MKTAARINGEVTAAPEGAICYRTDTSQWVMSLDERREIESQDPTLIVEITDVGLCGGCGCDVLLNEAKWHNGNCYCDGCYDD